MKNIKVKIKGVTPLLQHRFTEDELMGLLGAKTEKRKDKAELTPRQIAESYVYKGEDGTFQIPTSYILGAFKSVASEYKQKNSVRKSMKSIAGGILTPQSEFVTLIEDDGTPLKSFEVDIRKATNHQKGAVAVCRPRFDKWSCEMDFMIDDDLASPETIHQILNDAGKRSGIGSFRVSKGGSFGQFRVTEFTEIQALNERSSDEKV